MAWSNFVEKFEDKGKRIGYLRVVALVIRQVVKVVVLAYLLARLFARRRQIALHWLRYVGRVFQLKADIEGLSVLYGVFDTHGLFT